MYEKNDCGFELYNNSELCFHPPCKRNLYERLVETLNHIFRVSVKSKTGSQWPKVGGIWSKGDLLVFVDFKKKELNEKPDFYILNVNEWKRVATSIVANKTDGAYLNEENTVCWEPWENHPKGWTGCSISLKHVEQYKDNWPKPR